MSHAISIYVMSLFPYLRVDALHPGALAAAAVVDEALVDVVAVEAVPGPPDRAVAALERWRLNSHFSGSLTLNSC